jgi:hypothetical protein
MHADTRPVAIFLPGLHEQFFRNYHLGDLFCF